MRNKFILSVSLCLIIFAVVIWFSLPLYAGVLSSVVGAMLILIFDLPGKETP